jgi:hypothetical protein
MQIFASKGNYKLIKQQNKQIESRKKRKQLLEIMRTKTTKRRSQKLKLCTTMYKA